MVKNLCSSASPGIPEARIRVAGINRTERGSRDLTEVFGLLLCELGTLERLIFRLSESLRYLFLGRSDFRGMVVLGVA